MYCDVILYSKTGFQGANYTMSGNYTGFVVHRNGTVDAPRPTMMFIARAFDTLVGSLCMHAYSLCMLLQGLHGVVPHAKWIHMHGMALASASASGGRAAASEAVCHGLHSKLRAPPRSQPQFPAGDVRGAMVHHSEQRTMPQLAQISETRAFDAKKGIDDNVESLRLICKCDTAPCAQQAK